MVDSAIKQRLTGMSSYGLMKQRHQLIGADSNILGPKFPGDIFHHIHRDQPICQEDVQKERASSRRAFLNLMHRSCNGLAAPFKRESALARSRIDRSEHRLSAHG